MALEPAFSEAFIHRLPARFSAADPWSEHRVLGRRLRPLSLWHLLLLAEIESPLITGNPVGPHDLLRATSICRCLYPAVDLSARSTFRAAWSVLGKGALRRQIEAFRAYNADFHPVPKFTIVPREGGSSAEPLGAAPELLQMVADVMHITHLPPAGAWNMAPGEARWWQLMTWKSQGVAVDFMTPKHRASEEEIRLKDPALYSRLTKAARDLKEGK